MKAIEQLKLTSRIVRTIQVNSNHVVLYKTRTKERVYYTVETFNAKGRTIDAYTFNYLQKFYYAEVFFDFSLNALRYSK